MVASHNSWKQKMNSKFVTPNLPILNKHSINHSKSLHYTSTSKCKAQTNQVSLAKSTQAGLTNVKFYTLNGCKLGISRYPDFEYNAGGGIGIGIATRNNNNDSYNSDVDELSVSFDVKSLFIPALSSKTTKFLGLPLPPFLKIEIAPVSFQGVVNTQSGKIEMEFKSRFNFSVGSIYKAPPLIVETTLTSEESTGTIRRGKGERLNEEGKFKLVGVATVDPVDDALLDLFLGLPTECIAELNASIEFI